MKRYLHILLILFTISIAVPSISVIGVNSHGLFGEVSSTAYIEEECREIVGREVQSVNKDKRKGLNFYNLWLIIYILILGIKFFECCYEFPKKQTLVAMRIRMDN